MRKQRRVHFNVISFFGIIEFSPGFPKIVKISETEETGLEMF
jgi:hypothetical protein